MTAVPTAKGEIDSSQLGVTLMHEHILYLSPEMNQNYPETFGDEEARIADAVRRLNTAKQAGVDTIVDLTVLGSGRYIPRIQWIAKDANVNIVVGTGYYTWNDLAMFFKLRGPGGMFGGDEIMTDYFVRDIEEGFAGTDGVRAGILKCATDTMGVTPEVERVLRAVADAHRRTGVPITTHTYDSPNGTDQQQIFREEGVDLSRVIIGHLDRALHNREYVLALLEAGSYVGFDQWGFAGLPEISLADRANAIADLCERGYANRIVLSHDHFCFADLVPAEWDHPPDAPLYTIVPTEGVTALRNAGVSEEHIQQMLVGNPRAIFESTALGAY